MSLPHGSLQKLEQILPILEHIDSTVGHLRTPLKDPLSQTGHDLRAWSQDIYTRRVSLSPEQFDREMQVGMTLAIQVLEHLARAIEASMVMEEVHSCQNEECKDVLQLQEDESTVED